MKREPALGCVILTHGQGREASRLAEQLIEQDVTAGDIVVVHNPVGPEALELTVQGLEVLRLPDNLGYPVGMNTGARHQLARGAEQLLFLTHDVVLRPGAVAALRSALGRHEDLGVVGPALMKPGTDDPFSYGTRALPGGGLDHIRRPPADTDGVAAVESIDGAVMLVRASAFERAGPFDERFFLYFEESDLCLRIRRAGYRVGVTPQAVAEQESGSPKRPGAFGYLMGRNGLEYARRAAGVPGVAITLARYLAETAMLLGRPVRSLGRRGLTPAERAELIGTWAGTVAWVLRRWGSPPGFLAGLGDMRRL